MYVGSRWRSFVRLCALAIAVSAIALLPATPASAHAAFVSSNPAHGAVLPEAPDEVLLTFNEPVQLPAEGIRLFDADGQTLGVDAHGVDEVIHVSLPDAMEAGTYLLSWRVISADGHPLSGSVSFSAGHASTTVLAAPAPDPSGSAAGVRSATQGVHYAALLLAAGLLAFALLLPRDVPSRTRRRLRTVTWGASLLATLAAVALIPLSAAVKLDRGLGAVMSSDGWDLGLVGAEWLSATLVAAGLTIALASEVGSGTRRRGLALVGATTALIAPSLVGHTRSVEPEALLILTDVIHLTAGAIWLGGLVGLALTLRSLGDTAAAAVLSRFSVAAATSLAVLMVMGTLLAWRIVESWGNLVHTTYGVLLLVKIAIVGVAVGVAIANRFILLPRVRRAAHRSAPGRSTGLIRRAIVAEGAILVVALLVTGFLVDQAPHPQPALVAQAAPDSQTRTAGDLRVVAALSSGTVGPNTLRIETHTLAGVPRIPSALPVVSLRSGSIDLGQVVVTRTGPGTYQAPVTLPEGGSWEVQVSVRLSKYENPVLTLPFPVSEA